MSTEEVLSTEIRLAIGKCLYQILSKDSSREANEQNFTLLVGEVNEALRSQLLESPTEIWLLAQDEGIRRIEEALK